ncbi:MAG TPA: DUF5916 domain-containing protein [Pyrinomonadaceae bacterium]|nr:DUF5916 domain-containing protein [Pyrinomonadaceae bacterium]
MTKASKRFDNRLKRLRARLILSFSSALFALAAQAQDLPPRDNTQQSTPTTTSQSQSQNTGTRRIQAVRVSNPIKIDGLLDESSWSLAQAATEFLQERPTEGAPATERTEVRVLFDDKNIYFGIRAFDSEATHINARDLVRDSSFPNDDRIEILLDTYHDRRNAFRFAVNPLGTQQDALITDEGRDINISWDGSWVSEGRIDAKGFTVEIAIPLTTLRFTEGIESWGLNISRIIRRKNEENLWTSWQRSFGLERVSQAGELSGVEEIRRPRLREIKPYASGEWREGVPLIGKSGLDAGVRVHAGIEVARLGITPSLTAEFTVNPDFGQAEVDDQIVNLSRFSVFFPEKRDFFLENSGIFLFGRQGENQAFFTRRIGLTDRGQPVPIDYGVKVTGKVGPYNIGFLQVQTRKLGEASTGLGIPRQQFSVLRVKRDILKRSYVGAILVNRQGATAIGDGSYNRVGGADAEFNISDHYTVKAFWMGSATPGVRSSAGSSRLESIFENDLYRFITVYEDVGAKFNPEVGFIERNAIHQYFGQFAYKPRPKFIPHVQQMEFETQIEYYTDRSGKLATRQTELSWDTIFKNSSEVFFRPIEAVNDVLTEPFQIRPGIIIPAGTYRFNRPQLSFTSDLSKPIVFRVREKWGDFYSGTRYETSGGITWRPNPHVLIDLSESYNKVHLREGDFTTSLFSGRLNYNFSRKLLTSALVQLNSAARLSVINVRLRYIYRPNSDFFIIYNQTTGAGLERPSYSFQIKLTRDFTF